MNNPGFRERIKRANKVIRSFIEPTYERFDADLQKDLRNAGISLSRIPCKKGCAHCCEMAIFVSLPEAALIVERYPQVVRSVRGELMRQEALTLELGVTEAILNIFDQRPETTAARSAFNRRFWETKTPCPFLDKTTKACRVYEARPLACRNHTVVDLDPKNCGIRTAPGLEEPSIPSFDPPTAYLPAMQTIYNTSHQLYGAATNGLLQVMVMTAAEGGR